MKHVHVSALTGLTIACYMIIIAFLLRSAAIKLADKPGTAGAIGQGLAFIL